MAEQAYLQYFGLARAPFSIAPDPHFLYLGQRHREALAHLVWGLGTDGGFVVLTGEVGTGKTTISRTLLAQIPDDTDVAFVINPRLSPRELLATLCEELGDPPVPDTVSAKQLVDRINQRLLDAHAQGRRTVLVIDEAQNLSADVLEQIRLLTNLETSERKLLQVILIGQPELDAMLRRNDLRQLAQRITARYHLEPLSRLELERCIRHRLDVAGARRNPFSSRAMAVLHRRSGGIPRVANLIADRALLGAYARDADRIGADIIRQAAREVAGEGREQQRWPLALSAGVLAVVMAGGIWWTQGQPGMDHRQPITATADTLPGEPVDAERLRSEPPDPAATSPLASTAVPGDDLQTEDIATPDVDISPVPDSAEEEAVTGSAETDSIAVTWELGNHPGRRSAMQAIINRWFVPLEVRSAEEACAQAASVGLGCLTLDTDWDELIALDLPAVLESRSDHRDPVALLAVRPRQAATAADSGLRWQSQDALRGDWNGSATLLWQLPPGYRQPLARGSRGEPVRWLRRQLREAGHPASGAADEFDAALEAAVRSFQQRSGIDDDGIAGPITWIHLQRLTSSGIPSLSAAEDG